MLETESETVIIGASAAGLATAACLKRGHRPFVLLEQSQHIASAWRRHYERLHLHTSKGLSTLPHMNFPRKAPRYPSRAQVIEYLESYAARFSLVPRFNQRVVSVRRNGESWLTKTESDAWRSRHVVVATGYTRIPKRPGWPGIESFKGPVIHSSEYRNGQPWAGRNVLVIGFGNSGGEIALDLREHGARPSLSVRSPVNIVPRDFLGLPILAWGILLRALPTRVADAVAKIVSRLTIGSLSDLGLRQLPYGPMAQIRGDHRIPLLDIGTVAAIRRREIEVLPGVESFDASTVRFSDGKERAFDAVVLATGYRPSISDFLEGAEGLLDENGAPRNGANLLPGLHFCGFNVVPTGMLREISREARRIAQMIASPSS